ncbi:hypothetical protein HOP50_01g04520 [Chloropicon primus]|uniref:Uncharacterized protein n=1 Tax=Chloropicon primus TaxID=1764295 RepID=A0A5B8MBY1_9CHLO|nr:hypothetical protein A3770_01p04640 [Chloropicon primus]UPQ97161.1 hypothetical protein HOP50_01g04520 [Chloropicon primus]|mmetsp:Transcript_9776/g.27858  ORF Transcript_9776/g.27858 Transcript_9776/m.27858 type:complete len:134 (-) Transcript_9776:31-432(-)|eukprot:QDZ17946.1 hypothetical protein A3770_01p04640 [Chloropicon primus]
MGSSEYLMKVQNLSNAETAGISQPQTLAQKLRYELEAEQEEELDALQEKLGELYSSIEGAEDSSKYLTYNVVRSKTYDKSGPKLITMQAAEKLFLANPEQAKLLPATATPSEPPESKTEKPMPCYEENLNDID